MNESEDIRTTVEFLQTARFCSKVDLGSLLIDTAKSALGQTQVRDSKKIGGGYVTFFDRAIFGLEHFQTARLVRTICVIKCNESDQPLIAVRT